jgi:ABC-2 type transport system permease protein
MTPAPASRPAVIAAIAGVNLVRLSRDRLGLFFIVVLPFLIILLFGVAAGGGAPGGLRIGVAGGGEEEDTRRILAGIEAQEALEVRRYERASDLSRAVRHGTETAGLVIPDDYGARIEAGEPVEVQLLSDPSGGLPEAVRTAVSSVLAEENLRVQPVRVVSRFLERTPEELGRTNPFDLGEGGVTVRSDAVDAPRQAGGVDRSAAANLVLFVFITSLVGGSWLVETRRLGLSNRMFATPARSSTILLGEATGRFAIAVGQGILVVAGAVLLFRVDWGNIPAVLVIILVFSLAGTGAAMLMGALFSNAEQATAVAPPLGIALGMLGGCMWPLEIVPVPLQVVGRLTPHAWAMDALTDVIDSGVGVGSVLGPLAVLTAYAAVLLAGAAWALQRTLLRR